ncbi:MAG: hypothetical protein KC441_18735 [Anaerolineales bacterium]|nr:hypothetical protein [Anaerolineales bacterium]
MSTSTSFPKSLAQLRPGSPSLTWPGYRLDDLAQAEPILTAIQLWNALFSEPFLNVPITLNQQGTAVVITHLLAYLWKARYPLWQDEARFLQVSSLIHHLQNSDDGSPEIAMTPLQVDCLRVYLTLGQRYAELFPDNTTWPAGIAVLDEDSLTTAVSDFLTAVDRDYFPVDDELWVEDIEYLAGRLEYIDLIPQGHELDPDFFDDLDEYEEPLRMLLQLARDEEATDLPSIELYGLSEVIAALPLPLPIRDNLPALVQLVTHSTGNAWLDWSYGDLAQGGISLPEWCADNVAFLKEEWAAAQSFLDQEKALIRWVNADRPTRLAAVRGALYLAFVFSKKGVRHETGPRRPDHLSRSDPARESARRWVAHHSPHLASRSGWAVEPDPPVNRSAAS